VQAARYTQYVNTSNILVSSYLNPRLPSHVPQIRPVSSELLGGRDLSQMPPPKGNSTESQQQELAQEHANNQWQVYGKKLAIIWVYVFSQHYHLAGNQLTLWAATIL